MASDFLVEEREEVMVNPSKSHLLKPCSSSIGASSKALVSRQNRSDSSSLDSKALSLSVSFNGWRIANIKFKSWATKMAALHKPIWIKAGIFEAVMASTNTIRKDIDLVLSVAEKWCPVTNTFVFPWGEATITLEDVMVLLSFSVFGGPVFAALDSEGEKIKAKLVKEWCKIAKGNNNGFVTQVWWIKRFKGCGDELEHVAFLVLWLSYFVFPSHYYHICKAVFPIAVHLSRGTRIALAPAVLAHLYADLSILKSHILAFTISKDIDRIDLRALFKLVQVWTWERFGELQPVPNELIKGDTRLALWHGRKYKTSRLRQVLDYSKNDGFEWRPYTKTVESWEFPKFYPERAMFVRVDPNLDDEFVSFARCFKVCKLVGIDCMEHYFPNRVLSQFGMDQDVPGPVKRNKLSQKKAWNDYSKSIDGSALHIPSRSATGCDTQMFKEWRRKCTSEKNLVVEADETLKPRNMTCMKRVRGDDENSFVLSSCKMKRTSENVRKVAANFINKRRKYLKLARDKRRKYMKRARENAIDNDEDSDSLTISQLMKKKYSHASEWVGEKSKLEEDINDSGPIQKPECLLHEDDAIIGEEAHNNEPAASQKLANGEERSKAYKKNKKQLEDMEKRNEDVDEVDLANDASYQKSLQNLQEMSESIEKSIEEAKRNVAWLKEQRAIRQRYSAAARWI